MSRPLFHRIYLQVLVAILIGVVFGFAAPERAAAMRPLGDAFIKLVRMLIAPIVFTTVVVGIARVGEMREVGRIGLRALIYFEIVSSLALIIGLVVVNVLKPGVGINAHPSTLDPEAVAAYTKSAEGLSTVGFLLNIIPDTVVGAFANGDILQVLFFSVLFGFGLAFMGDRGKPVLDIIKVTSEAIFGVVHIIMKVAPIGAFGAMAFTIGKYGVASLANLAYPFGAGQSHETILFDATWTEGGVAREQHPPVPPPRRDARCGRGQQAREWPEHERVMV